MAIADQQADRVSGRTIAALMLAVFTVSVGYGVTLPLLPGSVERLIGSAATTGQVSRHTGLLAAIYLLALVLFAPAWGQFSDKIGRYRVLVLGLIGFATTMWVSSYLDRLSAVYAERFFSGVFAAAITPVATALVGDARTVELGQARRLTMVSLAGMAGFLLGPMLGVLITRVLSNIWGPTELSTPLALPLRFTALLALAALALARLSVDKRGTRGTSNQSKNDPPLLPAGARHALLILTFIVSSGVGVFEIDLALRGEGELGLAPYQVALMFSECSLIMIFAQMIGFAPGRGPTLTRWLIAPALIVLAIGLAFVPYAKTFPMMLAVVALVSGSAGTLSPILTYWISLGAGSKRGSELGRQTAASSLGGAVGSLLGGFLLGVGPLSNSSLVLVSGGTLVAGLLSFRVPGALVSREMSPGEKQIKVSVDKR